MPPSTIETETGSRLTQAAIEQTVIKTAPSLASGSPCLPELDASKLTISRTTNPRSVPAPDSKSIWTMSECTDHMMTVSWTSTTGWGTPELKAYAPFTLQPTASVLHYATACFEGMKLYRGFDGRLRLFRPSLNSARMLSSSARISLPAFSPAELEALISSLCSLDGPKWLPPERPGTFLYIRPTHIATDASLGVRQPQETLLFVILTCFPVLDEGSGTGVGGHGPSSDEESSARPGLRLLASKDDIVRAWPGGFGHAKVGANYGPSMLAQAEAQARGYSQILWLFGEEGWVTEAGGSNFFVVWKAKDSGKTQLVTAPLDDRLVLPGVTRRSVMDLAEERLHGELEIVERSFGMTEIAEAVAEGRMMEAFTTGTAFFIAPVGEIHFRGKDIQIPLSEGSIGRYAAMLKGWLKDIMYGKEKHPWGVVVEEKEA